MSLNHNKVLHECRTANLRNVDAEGKVFVSIGANGKWYFDWVHECCGTPSTHIGVEYYMQKPEGLPDNVSWVANTAGSMPDVASDSADIVFSGQNIEHLWKHDISGFLTEARRILKPGGLLVLDSPNREITAAYGVAHPEHLIEFTVGEMQEMLTATGFDVEECTGIFLCRDPRSGKLLPYQSSDEDPPYSTLDRCVSAGKAPEHSYIWWIRATRNAQQPDLARLTSAVDRCWEIAWPERMQRMHTNIGSYALEGEVPIFQSAIGESGALIYGPYAPIDPGRYSATMWVKLLSETDATLSVGKIDVCTKGGEIVVERDLLAGSLSMTEYRPISLFFELPEMHFGFQNRVFTTGNAALAVHKRSDLKRLDENDRR